MSYTIFEQGVPDNYYISLESDFDSTMAIAMLNRFAVTESMMTGSPILMAEIGDGLANLLTTTYLAPDAKYTFRIGTNEDSAIKGTFGYSKMDAENMALGKMEHLAMDISFVNDKWTTMLKDTHSRSWIDTRYSDVVADIASDAGFSRTDIEQSKVYYNVIQPDWTNLHMIKWLARQAVNTQDMPGFMFFVTMDDQFVFKTIDSLINEEPKATYRMSNPTNNEKFVFGNIELTQDYAPNLKEGGFGYAHMFFDFTKKQFVTGETKFSTSGHNTLSDWCFLAKSHETAGKRFYGGLDTNSPNVAEGVSASRVIGTQEIRITVPGNTDIHAGDIVKVVIPPSEYFDEEINEYYSGRWLVSELTHDVNVNEGMFQSHLTLNRHGLNSLRMPGLTRTGPGKVR